jgi:two-component system NtrC family response regulator
VVARAIHFGSPERDCPFVAVNCAGIPEGLLESLLFGHVKGAFTGAVADTPGFFRAAEGGTLFLDEIAQMPVALQSRLLRAIQEREVTPVGGTRPVKVDVRLITATSRPLEKALTDGRLREDLFYRLAVVPILLPPLRKRPEDVPLLVSHFNARLAEKYRTEEKDFTPDAIGRLRAWSWPGNIRELQNLMERLYATTSKPRIDLRDLPLPRELDVTPTPASAAGLPTLEEVESNLIRQVLEAVKGNRSEASRILRIERHRLMRKIRKYGLEK